MPCFRIVWRAQKANSILTKIVCSNNVLSCYKRNSLLLLIWKTYAFQKLLKRLTLMTLINLAQYESLLSQYCYYCPKKYTHIYWGVVTWILIIQTSSLTNFPSQNGNCLRQSKTYHNKQISWTKDSGSIYQRWVSA